MKVNRINNINGYISSTMNYHIKIYFVLIWSKTEFCTKQQQSVLSSSARPRERQRGGKLQCWLEYVLQWRNPCSRSQFWLISLFPWSLAASDAAWSRQCLSMVVSANGSIWGNVLPHFEFFFWMHICSSLRIRRAHITGSKGNFLEWYVAQTTSWGAEKRKNSWEGTSASC